MVELASNSGQLQVVHVGLDTWEKLVVIFFMFPSVNTKILFLMEESQATIGD